MFSQNLNCALVGLSDIWRHAAIETGSALTGSGGIGYYSPLRSCRFSTNFAMATLYVFERYLYNFSVMVVHFFSVSLLTSKTMSLSLVVSPINCLLSRCLAALAFLLLTLLGFLKLDPRPLPGPLRALFLFLPRPLCGSILVELADDWGLLIVVSIVCFDICSQWCR